MLPNVVVGGGVAELSVARDGRLVDDFLFRRQGAVLHGLNAPCPAATACLRRRRSLRELLAQQSPR